ncbi:hypothetical protein LTR37_001532 [Vermiconidia calcicola]|uniref:Uncharacterized protein n=1 Tax=Vermiconidia calcicola TaxID=1690605 RepID=A0ACC3NXV5_9PEZI|nr:hypothetical protein LTR37_001532 [Vermiconidia calcicola]
MATTGFVALFVGPTKQEVAAEHKSEAFIPLLSLPPELRNYIYEHALPPSDEEYLINYYPRDSKRHEVILEPALLLVCKSIRAEALSVCYGIQRLRFPGKREYDRLPQWFLQMGPERIKHIRRLEIVLPRSTTQFSWTFSVTNNVFFATARTGSSPRATDSKAEYTFDRVWKIVRVGMAERGIVKGEFRVERNRGSNEL